ncbi:MAG TPA: YfcE family phosphodiesterase [Marinilabiliales bacterium]|jgi:hypothetical protein|nr:MAG: YfcE family phosphodiesterase [Bacteroidetes bacterium GWA2_40_14]OFX61225.1 MAG: YfcE family phosphodiesterase [Bacteroidetes bacterium GWC2_40_13]OFX75241.1 MAG: YfcE family phosphodiesterase [Bacteroidetes bacterium GWD2_40_43]OFX89838.1 MAG: YfcE family phosphodiesterase [Bacteroidetes bacterium GWE2_40_63]OFY21969.1 MAG: YfcE family phosphodiesterase [Bacteroidetes bacterium GWF2_40_13]OFZ30316.1 MAG: YfcE family phosphodiesterase [Bacteroidetes bacterium RIFOXYC2_FULL_40_12]HAM9
MYRIGLLSDTHGYIDDQMLAFFAQVDEIWHVGDIGSLEVTDTLKRYKPLVAVYGNIDDAKARLEFPETAIISREQVKIILTHIGGYPGHYATGITNLLKTEKPQLFVAGHSHILKVIYDQKYQCLHLNPGAAGKSGFHQVRTMMRFVIDQLDIKEMEIWETKR